jgi:TPR repeat protein
VAQGLVFAARTLALGVWLALLPSTSALADPVDPGNNDLPRAWAAFQASADFDMVSNSYAVLNLFPAVSPGAEICRAHATELLQSRAVNPFSPALQLMVERCLEVLDEAGQHRVEQERSRRLRDFLLADGHGESTQRPILIAAEVDAAALVQMIGGAPLYGRYVVGAASGSLPFVAIYLDASGKHEAQLHFDFLQLWMRLQSHGAEQYPAILRGLAERYLTEADQAGNPGAELAKLTVELGREEITPAAAAARIEALALGGSIAATFELLPLCLIVEDQGRCARDAVNLVRPHAERGLAEAMIVLALAADRGIAGAGNHRDGRRWLDQAAKRLGEAEALTAYAQLSISIESRQQISRSAADALRRAARSGSAPATLLLVQMLRADRIRKLRSESADRWLRRAVDGGSTEAMAQLGLEYLRLGRFRDGWPLLERAATANDPTALGLLAIGHDTGKLGLDQDSAKAMTLYQAAAHVGNAGAMRRLGRAYANGELDLSIDMARAEAWFLSASLFGSQKAATELAELYLSGAQGVIGKPSDGYAVIEKLAADGMVTARLRMAVALLQGQGVKANAELAVRILQELAADQVAAADFRLAQIYEFGQGGVAIDLTVALAHYARAAQAGHLPAADYYARALYAGRGGPVDRAEALRWWTLAADKGNAGAIANLGWVRCSSRDPQVRDPLIGTRLVSEALQRKPSANLSDSLAACLAATGLFDQAVATQEQTLTMAEHDAGLDADQRRAFAERLAQYQDRKAWFED